MRDKCGDCRVATTGDYHSQCIRVSHGKNRMRQDFRSRNAFMHFLNVYRQQQRQQRQQQQLGKNCKKKKITYPAWMLASEAGILWSKMPLSEKYCYIAAARAVGYSYKARDRRMNRVMHHLRKALNCNDNADVLQLTHAVKQMQLWKRCVLRTMCSSLSET